MSDASRAVILISGGMDSATLLHYVVKRLGKTSVYALTVHYGQRHSKELEMAEWQCAQLKEVKAFKSIDISALANLTEGASALTDMDVDVPRLEEIADADRDQPATYVPNRNMTMLAFAVAYAESTSCDTVYYGAQAQDEYGYWDCTEEFVSGINAVLNLNRKNKIAIEAPFIAMRKSEELAIGLELGVNFSKTWSCYRGGDLACGNCPTCVERLTAFKEAGASDPLSYQNAT